MATAIGPVPTPQPPSGVSYNPQLTGGQVYNEEPQTDWNIWNQGWNEGFNNPTRSYSGGDKSFATGYLVGQQEYSNRNKSTPASPYSTPSLVPNVNEQTTNNNQPTNNNPQPQQKSPEQLFKEQYPETDIMAGQDVGDFMKDVEDSYNRAMERAGKQREFATQLRESNKADIEKQYGVGEQTLGSSRSQALGTIGESGISARQRQEQALDAARRLYDEMNRGYQQRFGGASSAGEGAKALANIEQQRQMGTTRQGYQDTMRQLETQKLQVEDNYKNEILGLQAKRDSAVTQANNSFSSAMLQIDQDVDLAADERSNMKYNLLKEYKDKLFNIATQEKAFRQNIDLMREQANIQLGTATKQLASYGQSGQNAYNQFASGTTLNPRSGLGIGVANTAANQMTGQVSDDELSRILAMTGQINQAPSYLQKSWNDVPAYFQQ